MSTLGIAVPASMSTSRQQEASTKDDHSLSRAILNLAKEKTIEAESEEERLPEERQMRRSASGKSLGAAKEAAFNPATKDAVKYAHR